MLGSFAAAAAVLLVASGLAKVRAPAPTAVMLGGLLPALRVRRMLLFRLARTAGVFEAVLGAAFLAIGGRVPAALLAAAYLAFTAVGARLLVARAGAGCGCFGRSDAPVGAGHLALTVFAAGVAVVAAVRPVGALGGLLSRPASVSVVGLVEICALAGLGYLLITALPELRAARRTEEIR